MLNLINQIVARAKANRQRIVLPEGTEAVSYTHLDVYKRQELIGEIPIPIVLYGKRGLKSKCKCSVISCI